MTLDLEALKAAALSAGGGQWTATDCIVWFDDGDSALIADPVNAKPPVFLAYDNMGSWPEPITREDVAAFAALACPAAILALIERLEKAEADLAFQKQVTDAARDQQAELLKRTERAERNRDMWKGQCERQAEALRKQAGAATMGMDAAKRHGSDMLQQAKALHGQSNPDALASERAANALKRNNAVGPDCHKCKQAMIDDGILPVPRMIVCPICGNKRCPKASDHNLPCTGSNELGQPGSIYGVRYVASDGDP